MTVIINPGSAVPRGTPEQARLNAEDWLRMMAANGIRNVEILDHTVEDRGRWLFTFRHRCTGITASLSIHGLDDGQVITYRDRADNICRALPRVYWNGSSTGDPQLTDFLTVGYHIEIVPD